MCEENNHEFKLEPVQTVSRAIDNGQIDSVTRFLKYCKKCGYSEDEIAIHEDYQFVNPENP